MSLISELRSLRLRSLAKGVASFVVPGLRDFDVTPSVFRSVESKYSVFLRYLIHLSNAGFQIQDSILVELGPGTSLAFGIAALLCGARRYHAFDNSDFTTTHENLATLAG
jgi:hypothetical protein